jgi:hypothetical protein
MQTLVGVLEDFRCEIINRMVKSLRYGEATSLLSGDREIKELHMEGHGIVPLEMDCEGLRSWFPCKAGERFDLPVKPLGQGL